MCLPVSLTTTKRMAKEGRGGSARVAAEPVTTFQTAGRGLRMAFSLAASVSRRLRLGGLRRGPRLALLSLLLRRPLSMLLLLLWRRPLTAHLLRRPLRLRLWSRLLLDALARLRGLPHHRLLLCARPRLLCPLCGGLLVRLPLRLGLLPHRRTLLLLGGYGLLTCSHCLPALDLSLRLLLPTKSDLFSLRALLGHALRPLAGGLRRNALRRQRRRRRLSRALPFELSQLMSRRVVPACRLGGERGHALASQLIRAGRVRLSRRVRLLRVRARALVPALQLLPPLPF